MRGGLWSVALVVLVGSTAAEAQVGPTPWAKANSIIAAVSPPTFPNRTFSVLSFGGNGDGTFDNTTAFASAISACNSAGGGMVDVPAGTFLTGAIQLKSNVNLHLESGAIINFDNNATEFPLIHTRYQGIDLMNFSPLVNAQNANNIAITGSGILDGSRTSAWNVDGSGNFNTLQSEASSGTAINQRIFGSSKPLRTTFIEPYKCANVLIQGVTVRNSRFWQLHPLLSTNVTVDSVTTASTTSQTDGCDPEGCTNVVIKNCYFETGDDCIAVKAGRNTDSQREHTPSTNIVVMNCAMDTNWGMITCGSEQSDGVQGVYGFSLQGIGNRPKFIIYLKTNSLRGGYIRDVYVDSVTGQFERATVFGMLHYNSETGPNIPIVTNINMSHCSVSGAAEVLDLEGTSTVPMGVTNILASTFNNITGADIIQFANSVTYRDDIVNGKAVGGFAQPPMRGPTHP